MAAGLATARARTVTLARRGDATLLAPPSDRFERRCCALRCFAWFLYVPLLLCALAGPS